MTPMGVTLHSTYSLKRTNRVVVFSFRNTPVKPVFPHSPFSDNLSTLYPS